MALDQTAPPQSISNPALAGATASIDALNSTGNGSTTIQFDTLAPTGEVTRTKVDAGKSTLHNGGVEDCVTRQIGKLTFPAKGGGFVNYPFIFSQGG